MTLQNAVDQARAYASEWPADEWNDPLIFARGLIKAADRISELEALLREAEKWIPNTMESKSGLMCGPTVQIKAKIAAAIRARGETT
jgi:hypothetical protein